MPRRIAPIINKLIVEVPAGEFERRCAADSGLQEIERARGQYRSVEEHRRKKIEGQISEQYARIRELNAQKRPIVAALKKAAADISLLRERLSYRMAPMQKLQLRERRIRLRIRQRLVAEATARAAKGIPWRATAPAEAPQEQAEA